MGAHHRRGLRGIPQGGLDAPDDGRHREGVGRFPLTIAKAYGSSPLQARRESSSPRRRRATKRAFLGWLRGERDHCKMVAIPTIKDEDVKRPNRERENLVGEQNRIINRMKATLIRLGIRGFNPKLKNAHERLEGLRTPDGEPIPPNTLAELHRDMERRRFVRNQIRQIESARLDRLEQAPGDGAHVMVRLLARVMGIGIETADML